MSHYLFFKYWRFSLVLKVLICLSLLFQVMFFSICNGLVLLCMSYLFVYFAWFIVINEKFCHLFHPFLSKLMLPKCLLYFCVQSFSISCNCKVWSSISFGLWNGIFFCATYLYIYLDQFLWIYYYQNLAPFFKVLVFKSRSNFRQYQVDIWRIYVLFYSNFYGIKI